VTTLLKYLPILIMLCAATMILALAVRLNMSLIMDSPMFKLSRTKHVAFTAGAFVLAVVLFAITYVALARAVPGLAM
jgi:hypothetical protein